MQPETNTLSTTQEPETPQADPAATAAREMATEPTPAPQASTAVVPAPASDPLESLRDEMHADLDVLTDALSTLTCHLINTQIAAYRERRRALLTARKRGPSNLVHWQEAIQTRDDRITLEKATADALREENKRLEAELTSFHEALQAAAKVEVRTSVHLPDWPETTPEPPELLGQITSQVADYVMFSERASVPRLTTEWYDDHTLAYLRKGWPQLSPVRQEAIAVHLMNEVCQPPQQRNVAWVEIVRAVQMAAGGAQ